MNRAELREALEVATRVSKDAGEILAAGFRTDFRVHRKGAIDLVTSFDVKSEEIVVAGLSKAFPSHHIVAEESAPTVGEDDALTWYVDPLDGTTNFAHGHPFFSVSIALCRGPELILGVVRAPALDVLWSGGRGLGVTRNGVRCRVSDTTELISSLGATGFPYDRRDSDEDNLRELAYFVKRTQGIRRCGSAAIDLALVADGTYDFYWEQKLKPWDMAAGAALVQEAGGQLSDYEGGADDVRQGRLVAAVPGLHPAVLSGLAEARTLPEGG